MAKAKIKQQRDAYRTRPEGENVMTANTFDPQTAKFLAVIGENMPKLSGEEMQRWIEKPGDLQRFLAGLLLSNIYPVTVNYDLSVEAAIRAGTYDWKNDNITAGNFPSKRQGLADLDIILVHYDRNMQDGEISADLGRQGLRDAELPELLALADKYPDLQREFPIVARGSLWQYPHGVRSVPCLYGHSGGRHLRLRLFDGGWLSGYRFAAVRK